jgi:hypothetical protein
MDLMPRPNKYSSELVVTFIDQYRDTYGVEPICAVLPIAPSTRGGARCQP